VRSERTPAHAGQISFPGGRVCAGESPIEAALREAQEEAGIAPERVEILGSLGVHRGGLGFSVTPVIGIVDPSTDFMPCPREVAEIFEVPFAFLADLSNHATIEKEFEGAKYNMFAVPYGRFHIWGLTAGILHTLAEALQADDPAPLSELRRATAPSPAEPKAKSDG
jgi:8-oxo-dGTP pyrophosphatase MutT (NUDIX family)